MRAITPEYFEETLDSMFPDKESLEMMIMSQFEYGDGGTDIVISNSNDLHEDKDVGRIYARLTTERYGITVYMYQVESMEKPDYNVENVSAFIDECLEDK